MITRQLRIRHDALKRKYAVPLPILRLRRRAEILCHNWETAEANNKPLPNTPIDGSRIRPKRRPPHPQLRGWLG